MKITLGAKELEKIVGSWATDRYEDGVPSVKIIKKRDSIDVIIDYTDAEVVEILYSDVEDYNPDEEEANFPAEDSEETQA